MDDDGNKCGGENEGRLHANILQHIMCRNQFSPPSAQDTGARTSLCRIQHCCYCLCGRCCPCSFGHGQQNVLIIVNIVDVPPVFASLVKLESNLHANRTKAIDGRFVVSVNDENRNCLCNQRVFALSYLQNEPSSSSIVVRLCSLPGGPDRRCRRDVGCCLSDTAGLLCVTDASSSVSCR